MGNLIKRLVRARNRRYSSKKEMRSDETEDKEGLIAKEQLKTFLSQLQKSAELPTAPYPIETIKQLQAQVEELKLELRTVQRIPSGKIGLTFLVPGALSLIFSVLANSQVLGFIGLGLTFWGALFSFISPIRYVKSSLLNSTAAPSYSTIDRMIKDLKYEGGSYYIPTYSRGVHLPEYLKTLKDMGVFISASRGANMPSIDEMVQGRFLLENPRGILVAPPGLGLLTQFEHELRTDITEIELSELCEILPRLILENFQFAKEIEMEIEKDQVHLIIFDSIYKNLYDEEENLKSIHLLGCPLVSAIACAIAKSTGKIVTIHSDKISPHGEVIEVWYRFAEG